MRVTLARERNGYKKSQPCEPARINLQVTAGCGFLACVWGTCVWGTCVWGACAAVAQQSVYEQLRGKNTAMTAVQPTWMSPLIEPTYG